LARVILTGALRERAGSAGEIEIDASNVRELIRKLEKHVPGIGQRVEDGLSIAIDGDIIDSPLSEPLARDAEIHFLPSLQGGA
jgi:molybdopterin converting factor small subunit